MKKMIRLATAGAILAAAASLNTAAMAATEEVGASATILEALDITEDEALDFANIAVNGAGSVVVGAGAAPDQCLGLLVCAGTKQAAVFTVNGANGLSIDASVSESSIDLENAAGDIMTVDDFTVAYPGASGDTITGGTTTFEVGATLNVAANQPVGAYTGTFNVEVVYD